MKKIIYIIVLILVTGLTAEAKTTAPPAGFGIFFSALNPHGVWMEIDNGLVVWRPTTIRRGWAPYREGRWIWTYDGWYWDSYEPFGYVTYHYGRWYYDDYYGWIWVPDYEWAPAWVEWRYDDLYIGWAPLSPYAVFSINIGIHFTHDYYTPYNHWHFVTYRYFDDPYVYKHFVGHKYKNRIYKKTKYRTNYGYHDGRVINRGVDIDYVRNRSGHEIRTRELERVRDYDKFERGEKNDRIRTLYVPKEELRKERDFENEAIKRSDRRSTLDVSRVEIGERRASRNDDRNKETLKSEEKGRINVRDRDTRNEREVQKKREDTGNERTDVNRNRTEVQEKRKENNVRESNDVRINTRNEKKVEKDRSPNEVRTPNNANEKREVKRTETRTERKSEVRSEKNDSRNDRNTTRKR